MTHAHFIEALGKGTKVAQWLIENGHSSSDPVKLREAVYKWGVNGVPWKYRIALIAMAQDKGVPVPPNFLKDGSTQADVAA